MTTEPTIDPLLFRSTALITIDAANKIFSDGKLQASF